MPRYSGRHGTAGGEPPRPPPLSSRHTSAATLPTQSRGRSPHPPSFSRRSTEPGEVLEEGELEVDERSFSRSNAMGHRTFTMPTDRSKSVRQHGDPGVSRYRGSRPTSSLSVHPSQGAAAAHHILPSSIERKHSQSLSQPIISRQTPPPMQHTRDRTPSPKHEPSTPPPSETIRTPPPAPARPLSLEAGKAQNSDNLRVSQPQVPRQELHSRISDIDREIAECQERLVMMSGASQQARSATVIAGNSSSNSEQPGFLATNDRTVPSLSISPQKLTASGVDGTMPKSVRPAEPTTGSFVDNPNTGISSSTFVDSPTPVVPESGTASGKGDVVGRDRIVSASTWPMYKSTDSQTTASRDDDVAESGNDSDSEEEEGEEDGLMGEHLVKNNLKPLVSGIYRENQMRAAEMQAKLGAPFLESFPTFVPGSYPSPTDWPFWDENVKMHGKVRPHLEKILSRETIQNKSHARKLQEEYSELYSKWRKRVDKLDRQREAKQRNMVGGPPTSAGGGGGGSGSGSNSAGGGGGVGSGSGSTQSGTSFASTSSRRRHVSGSTIPTSDEFGFSLGPLFSASTNTALASEAAGRMDDYFLSDAVHSEAELQAIIERLQHDDARNPDIRSQRTAAVIPNMVTDPKERERLRFNNNCHLVADPITFYHARMPEPGTAEHRRIAYGNNGDTDRCWTQNEVSAFVAAYLTHPKQFGKIASYIPYKTMNDCVLFYYRNKKSLRLKDLEAKSNKRVRRSRQAAASGGGGGAGGRKRKERARERRERRAREEREKLAQEAAAGCAPVEYSGDVLSVAASADDGQMSNTRTSTFPSDDEGNTAAEDARGRTPEYSAEEIDVLERRSKGSALLRSIIAANRQRKSQAAMGCISLLGLRNGTISDDSAAPLLSPMNDDDDDVEDETPTSATAPATLSTTPSRRSRHPNGIVPPGKSRRKSPEPSSSGRYSAPGPLSPISPRALVSAPDTRSRQADDGEDEGAGVYARRAATDEVEEGEERGSLRTEASANSEEEGELVEEEDSRWEPQRRSRLYMELTAYAMGGSIVRTRRGRELEREKFGGDADDYRSGSSDDERRADHRKTSPADLSYDEEEEEEDEIVEASGIVGGRFQGPAKGTSSGRANSGLKQQLMRPRIVSRRSQSRFGATLTAVVDPNDSGRSASSVVVDQGSEADGSLYLMHRQPSNQRSVGQQLRSPSSVSGADRQRFENDGVLSLGDPPKESALDRYVVDGAASDLMRPISSYEALFMCSPEETSASGGAVVASPVRSTAGLLPDSNVSVVVSSVDPGSVSMLSFNAQRQQQQQQQQRFSSSPSPSGKTRLLSATVSALSSKKQLDAQIEEEAGTQSSVLVGAAAWLREDRKRVLRGFHKLGPDFAQVASLMPSKTMAQCRYFYYHYRTPGGVLLSDIIPNSLSLASAAHLSESKPGGIGSLVLPQTGMQPVTEPSSTAKTSYSGTPRLGAAKGRPATVCADTLMSQGVLKPPPVAAGGGKRQRTKSPASQMQSSSDDEEDETPLAAQLAETLAAQQQQAPPVVGVNTLAFQQRRASELIAQVRRPPELISPRVTPMASLAPPIKASGAGQGTTSSGAVAAGYGQQQLGGGVGGSSGIHGIGRTPSPHTTGLAQSTAGGSGAMTAKKSGYSSYWSVHERSAFMHYVVRIGADWPALAEAIGSKTGTQVRNYFRANREKLGLDSVVAEFEKNKAAGTVPPLTPFQPVSAVSVSSQSPASGMMSGSVIGGDEGVKKEKRGRKRKNERIGAESPGVLSVLASGASSAGMVSSDSIPLSQLNRSGSMAEAVISPGSAVSGKALAGNDASQPPSTPNTAPATMTNFPTIGIDGGRAVVYRRPLAPAGGGAGHVQHRQGQAFAAQPPSALGYGQPRMAGNGESGGGPMGRAESETVSSQATPPP
ncbi:DNA-binding protein snt1, partial [Coemansia sp. RSA 1933]